jgi:hypothetical protein
LFIQILPEGQELIEFEKKFALVQIGDTEASVLSVLGQPDARENEFRLGQKKGFEEAYARANASDSAYYLLWFRGADVVFTFGIDDKGKVSVKESGGT